MRRHLNEAFSDLFKTVHPQWSDPNYTGPWAGPVPAGFKKPGETAKPGEPAKPGEELPEPPKEKAAKLPKMTQPGVQVVDKETNQEVVQIPGGVEQTVSYLARNAVRLTRSQGKYESDDYWFLLHGYDAADIRKIVKSYKGETTGQSLQRRYLPGRSMLPQAKKTLGRGPKPASTFRFQSPMARRKYTMTIQGKLPGRKAQQVQLNPREAVTYLQRLGVQRSGPFSFTDGKKTYDLSGFPPEYANKIVLSLVGESLLPEPPSA
jgi:hypothetical protein